MSSCVGSCIGGPVMEKFHNSPVKGYTAIADFAGSLDFNVDQPDPLDVKKTFAVLPPNQKIPTEAEITDILRQMAKQSPPTSLTAAPADIIPAVKKAIAIYQARPRFQCACHT